MESAIKIGIALFLAWPAGWLTKAILDNSFSDQEKPKKLGEIEWERLKTSSETPGKWIGYLERVLSFLAFWYSAYVLLAGWFALKLGAKWNAWASITKIPESYDGLTDNEWFAARRALASWISMRFLLGTIANVLLGWSIYVLAAAASQYLVQLPFLE